MFKHANRHRPARKPADSCAGCGHDRTSHSSGSIKLGLDGCRYLGCACEQFSELKNDDARLRGTRKKSVNFTGRKKKIMDRIVRIGPAAKTNSLTGRAEKTRLSKPREFSFSRAFNFGIRETYRVSYPEQLITCVLLDNDCYLQLNGKGEIYFKNQPGEKPWTKPD